MFNVAADCTYDNSTAAVSRPEWQESTTEMEVEEVDQDYGAETQDKVGAKY